MTFGAGFWRGHGTGITVGRAVAVVTPALAMLAPKATVPALITAVLLHAVVLAKTRRQTILPSITVSGGFAALIAWAFASSLWSIEPAPRSVFALLGLFVAGLLFVTWAGRDHGPAAVADALVIGISIALLGYIFEAISGAWLTRLVHGFTWRDIIDDATGGINVRAYLINGSAILSLLLWPAAASLVGRGRWVPALMMAALVVLVTIHFGSDSGLIALIVGGTAWFLAEWFGAHAARIAAIAFAVLVMAAPLVAHRFLQPLDIEQLAVEHPQVPNSAFVRLFIWKFAVERIAERPLLGWGFDAARRIPGGGDAIAMRTDKGRAAVGDIYLPLHPHNQVLQVWLELGVVGAVIVAFTGAFLIWRTGARAPPQRNAALAVAATVIVYDLLSFGAWQSWWIAAVFLAATLQSAVGPARSAPGQVAAAGVEARDASLDGRVEARVMER